MAERRSKGLCFNCEDLYAPGQVCKSVLFYILPVEEGDNQDEELIEEENIELSLNAMKGEQNDSTFQVNAEIANAVGWILLDTGSTHNFIKSSTAEKIGDSNSPTSRKNGVIGRWGQVSPRRSL